ncbi:ADP-ribosylation factor-like protein 6-interacting protein 4 [Sinocyclocheilus anshuiensis]|uniref:ADP-ribosylation factor-like protein 6-interacting protein 4 n=2 Tax=Sinocyclocheilus anshuiensis TaxID=1608454 RepID=A0A671L1R8_9TELE|nr:PREDICTED: ADP-ribosylation factor-like protein 6-interacting protein 4 [Sinocyclocheilus anshuiensis]XP_016360856.1 PREDICTED: ADP-ribosylation factor-like protein 6-interacting protein 4 [Sinocyclocheilus anshuiensis]
MGGSDADSRSKSRHRDESKSRSLSSSSARRSSPSPQKKHEQRKKKKRRSPSSSSSSSGSASPSREKKARKKKKQKLKREKKKEKKEKKRQKKLALKAERAAASVSTAAAASDETPQSHLKTWQCEEAKEHGPVMTDEQKARHCTKRPMTKEDYEARQSIIRRVLDPETGRTRLVRGDGEILEEIVSKERHKEINKQATKRDGDGFQKRVGINR